MSQSEAILNYLRDGNALTAIEALEKFGCFRLAARIEDLRKDGITVHTEEVVENGKRFARYSIPVQNPAYRPNQSGVRPISRTQGSFLGDQLEMFEGVHNNKFRASVGI